MLNVSYILEALMHNNIMQLLLPGWIRKDIEQQPNFCFRQKIAMLNVLYMLEAVRHNNIKPALLPGWTRENIEQQPNFYFRLRIKMLNVLYILEALRNKNIMPRTSTWVKKKGYRTIACFFFSASDQNA